YVRRRKEVARRTCLGGCLSRSFVKECRSLLLPWYLAAGAGLLTGMLIGFKSWFEYHRFFDAGVPQFFIDSSRFAFFVGIALLAAVSFGAEFQQRTLPLLLSQPCKRSKF